jgi:hypothetical protein
MYTFRGHHFCICQLTEKTAVDSYGALGIAVYVSVLLLDAVLTMPPPFIPTAAHSFALPWAFLQAGYVLGPVLLIAVCALSAWTHVLIVMCRREASSRAGTLRVCECVSVFCLSQADDRAVVKAGAGCRLMGHAHTPHNSVWQTRDGGTSRRANCRRHLDGQTKRPAAVDDL